MSMDQNNLWTGFQMPRRLAADAETLTERYGRFSAQPFERGFATTVGNSLRRALLSSIEGAAITAVHIEGVLHEFSSIPIRLHSDEPKIIAIEANGPRVVKAGDFVADAQIEIVDPERPVAILNE